MNNNTLTVVQGEDAYVELTVTFIPASTDTGRWDMTPEHTPLQIISVENSEGTDVMGIASNLFTDHDLAYNSSIELEHLTEIESLGWKTMKRTITLTAEDLEFVDGSSASHNGLILRALRGRLKGNEVKVEGEALKDWKKLDALTRPVKNPALGTAEMCKLCADRLNALLGTRFKPNAQSMKTHVSARLKEGYTQEDFLEVIEKKVAEWASDDRMRQYLRPETLFSPKFESYLNQPSVAREGIQRNADYTEGL